MRALGLLGLAALAAGCTGNAPVYKGQDMTGFFPFDGSQRWWEFSNDDPDTKHVLRGDLLVTEEDERVDDKLIHVVEWSSKCPTTDGCTEESLYTLRWTVDSIDGIEIHGMETVGGEAYFDAPIQFTDRYMKVGESVTSTADGHDFTSTFEAIDGCPQNYNDQWDDCAKIVLETTAGDHPLEGTWHFVPSFNVVSVDFANEDGRWALFDTLWEE